MIDFAVNHPALAWLAVAAVLLAIEVATGTGWLLWASGSAGAVSLATLAFSFGLSWQMVLFAVLAVVTSLLGRRFLPRHSREADDINDNTGRIVGRQARVVIAFEHGRGRVSIDGKEWAAGVVSGEDPSVGDLVEVTGASGAELSVRGL
ncbi:MAG: hypothetical protein BGN86_03015 [Caulobacterales bacterium 68-7]|nr:NfeD family protein [Caulobacterales bacterium]OJU10571.1 MAG: hypothetical protein BGN86_03015 [Caulobacterales bacterium 68-7]